MKDPHPFYTKVGEDDEGLFVILPNWSGIRPNEDVVMEFFPDRIDLCRLADYKGRKPSSTA